jgi:mono/diheme cytochrome c family protein
MLLNFLRQLASFAGVFFSNASCGPRNQDHHLRLFVENEKAHRQNPLIETRPTIPESSRKHFMNRLIATTTLIAGLAFAIGDAAASADEARARELYNQVCFNCHGLHFDGGIGPSLKDNYWRHGDSPDAILEVINKGIPEAEMIAFETVFPERDRLALRDLIVAQHEGLRGVVRSVYPRAPFKGKRLTPALFDSVKPLASTRLPENVYYFERNGDGILRGTSRLYIKEAGQYQFAIRPHGRTSIYLNGKEVHYSDQKTAKNTHVNRTFDLQSGIHDLEILHEEKTTHGYRFHGVLKRADGGKQFALNGRSLQGNIPKIIKATPEAKVVRKWIDGLPPRTLLCLLPNQALVAYNPVDGSVLKAWHSAAIDQTPSLPDRSAKPAAIKGVPIPDIGSKVFEGETLRFLRYEMHLDTVHLVSLVDGEEKTVTIAPEGKQSFILSVQ